MTEFLDKLLFAATLEMVLAAGVIGAIAAKHRLTVGAPVRCERGSAWFLMILAPLALALAITIQFQSELVLARFLPALVAVVFCVLCLPRTGSNVLGTSGVRVGWRSRAFDQLKEWRLTGDHLRVHVAGEWRAVFVPVAEHEELRKRLEVTCPDRESRFKV